MTAIASSAPPAIVPLRPEHRPALTALWRRYFGAWSADRLDQRWWWQFEDNPCRAEREPVMLVALAGDQLVGHISGIPVPLLLDGRRSVALVTSGLVVDEQHRWVALRLISALFKGPPFFGRVQHPSVAKLYAHHGASILPASTVRFSFPRRYRGWLTQSLRRRLPKSLDPIVTPRTLAIPGSLWHPSQRPAARRLPHRAARGVTTDIRRLDSFGAEYDELWSRAHTQWRCSVDKDSRFMTWRYQQCPTLHATSFGLYDQQRLRAIAVGIQTTGTDRSLAPCGSGGEIVELITDDPANPALEALLLSTMQALDRLKVDDIGAGSLHPSLHPLLERIGFTRETSDSYQVALAGPDSSTPTSDDAWYYTAADSDALYSPGL